MTISQDVIDFYEGFTSPTALPEGVVIHNPFENPNRRSAIEAYYQKFFSDRQARVHLLGINPSRLTPTSTGVHYTDGYALETNCGIKNDFSKSRELTSDFFYRVISAIGGSESAFSNIFPWALMPLSVTKDGLYKNHYDDEVSYALSDIVIRNALWISQLPTTGRLVVLGVGENRRVFENLEGSPFGYNDVRYLPHPRWIMQYNRERIDLFVEKYVECLT